MVTYFRVKDSVYAVCSENENFSESEIDKLCWLFSSDQKNGKKSLSGRFRGPRREMLTPWSTNAVEITLNMGITGIRRIERLLEYGPSDSFDPMLEEVYTDPAQDIFDTEREPEPVKYIDDIEGYNKSEGLALSPEEIKYLEKVSTEIGRPLTDSEVFGFSQVNSEHCRHKIFNGLFIIDGTEMELSPFALIKKTSEQAPGNIVSAYKDNVAFIKGPPASLFCPELPDSPSCFSLKKSGTVLSLKAETHNFPTTVEPFNGASTGTGGEIRDRMAGGRA
ncbi:MAG: phosphoribosylformylglycinamidine synthase, partial [Fibrobacterota bacterium]